MQEQDLKDLRVEFDKFVNEGCTLDGQNGTNQNPEGTDKEDEQPVPQFVDALTTKLLAPAHSGVYLSRLDIKRIAESIDESIPIKERLKMVRALFRHTTRKEYLDNAFSEINKHINGRVLIYQELAEAFPSSKPIFEAHTKKAQKTMKMLQQIVADFEEIEPTSDPLAI